MARGRTLFSEHRRRAASVPVADLSFPDSTTTSKLFDIKSHVANDTDALMSASKRHDRDFLHSLQTKLASPPLLKATPTLNHNRARGPPPSRSAYYTAAASSSSVPRDQRRRTWYGPASNRVDDYEVAAFLATPIRPPYVSRVLRGSSVPPVLPSRATTARWYPGASIRGASVPRWAPSSYRTYGSGRSYLQSHPDREDIVVGVAPTALYGDIVIGIPYRKQFMFDVQHGLDAIEDYHPRIPVATRVTSPYFAYKNKPLLNSYEDDVDVVPYRRAVYSAPSYGTRSSISYYPSTQPLISAAATGARFSTIGHPPPRPTTTGLTSARAGYTVDLSAPKESFSNLRLRASLARDKANQHKTLLDRYLPVEEAHSRGGFSSTVNIGSSVGFFGPEFGPTHHVPLRAVVSTSVAAAPSLPPPLPSAAASASASAAAAAAAASGATSSKSFKPQISETRQRVRNLLCKSKKDPHYFD